MNPIVLSLPCPVNLDQDLQGKDLLLEAAIVLNVNQETGQGHLQPAIIQEDHRQRVVLHVLQELAVLPQRIKH